MTTTDWVATARGLAPLIEAHAAAGDDAGTIAPAVVSALSDAGLFAIMVPRALGGAEVDVATALGVFEALSHADASTGWCCLATASTSAFAGAYLPDAGVRAMWNGGPAPLHAGQFAPRGQAVVVDGGYRVTGEYSFGSGSGYATWIAAGTFPLDSSGAMPTSTSGFPEIRAVFVPKAQVEMRGNWRVLGLRGTGSYDYALHDVVVPAECTFSLLEAVPHRGGAIYALGVLPLTVLGHAAFALGVARRALDEITKLSLEKQRMGDARLADKPVFQHELARAEASLRAARLLVFDHLGAAERVAQSGRSLTPLEYHGLRLATTWATEVAREAVDFAYRMGGSHALREPNVLGRVFRDMHAATQHIIVDEKTYADAGATLLGMPPAF